MRSSVANRVETLGVQDYLQFGFGGPAKKLRELVKEDPDRTFWRVAERTAENSDRIFSLQQYLKATAGTEAPLIVALDLNADKGFLVTGIKYYKADGPVFASIEMGAEDVTGRGDWMITQVEDKTSKNPSSSQSDLAVYRLIKLQFKELNQPIASSMFEMKSLGLPENLPVLHEDLTGERNTWIVQNSHPLPPDLALSIDSAKREMDRDLNSLGDREFTLIDKSSSTMPSAVHAAKNIALAPKAYNHPWRTIALVAAILALALLCLFFSLLFRRPANENSK